MGNWQDWLVTAVAVLAGVLVVWRTLGSWRDSKPGSPNAPGCDNCAVADLAKDTADRSPKVRRSVGP